MFTVFASLYIDASIPPIIQALKNGRIFEFLNFCQSVFGVCNMSNSEKIKRSFRRRQTLITRAIC